MYLELFYRDHLWMADVQVGGRLVVGPRRRRSAVERRQIVEETLEAGASVARVALKYGVNANQVFQWRRLHRDGKLGATAEPVMKLLPVKITEEIGLQSLSRLRLSRPDVVRSILSCRARCGSVWKVTLIQALSVRC